MNNNPQQQPPPEASKWHYIHQDGPKKVPLTPKPALEFIFIHNIFYILSLLCPIGVLIALYWLCENLFKETYFNEPWMQPSVFLLAAYFSGVIIRLCAEQFLRSMGLYIVALLGLISYAVFCLADILQTGSLFSTRLLPETLHQDLIPYVFAIPSIALGGMLCYRWFTIK